MKFLFSRQLLVVALLSFPAGRILGGWQTVANFQNPVDCGFFFDENRGFVGTGNLANSNVAEIYMTSDGGTTWQKMVTPNGNQGSVSDIFMQDSKVGYASIMNLPQTLWKTTDGGMTWFDFTIGGLNVSDFNNPSGGASVYSTSKKIIFAQWPNDGQMGLGGVAELSGANFVTEFQGGAYNRSNGIDFVNDLHGVVTLGTQYSGGLGSYYTSDGGDTWMASNFLGESWGVYALKGSSIFFCAGEGALNNPSNQILRSDDYGATWKISYNFAVFNFSLTGHIAGEGKTIYVQTSTDYDGGLFRSDNLGVSWKQVNGPSNDRDTRFVVTGCAGEVVYAFDNSGAIYKTTDGGDGTLAPSNPDPKPYISAVPSGRAGDTVLIPILLMSSGKAFSMSSFTFHLSMNEDVLTPLSIVTKNTLSQNATTVMLDTTGGLGATCSVVVPMPITQNSNLTTPLMYVKTFVTLSDSLETSLVVDDFSLNNSATASICTTNLPVFQIQRECGDSLISVALQGDSLLSLLSIVPNPSNGDRIHVKYELSSATSYEMSVVNSSGLIVSTPLAESSGTSGVHEVDISTSGFPSGTYFLVLRSPGGSVTMKMLKVR
jgi:photosystem II stability/assembly factor-like uncharacterized protein